MYTTEKYLLALRCILATTQLSPAEPAAHFQIIRLQQALHSLPEPLPPKVSEIMTSEFSSLNPSSELDLQKSNDKFIEKHKDSPRHYLVGLQARQFLGYSSRERNEEEVLEVVSGEQATPEDAVQAIEIIREWGGDASKVMAKAAEKWPEANVFQSKEAISES